MDLAAYAQNGILKIIAKPNKMRTEIEKYDPEQRAVIVHIAAVPDKDKANKELVKFLSRALGRKVEIVKGMRSREKYIKII